MNYVKKKKRRNWMNSNGNYGMEHGCGDGKEKVAVLDARDIRERSFLKRFTRFSTGFSR